jgi:hypothetical protein
MAPSDPKVRWDRLARTALMARSDRKVRQGPRALLVLPVQRVRMELMALLDRKARLVPQVLLVPQGRTELTARPALKV